MLDFVHNSVLLRVKYESKCQRQVKWKTFYLINNNMEIAGTKVIQWFNELRSRFHLYLYAQNRKSNIKKNIYIKIIYVFIYIYHIYIYKWTRELFLHYWNGIKNIFKIIYWKLMKWKNINKFFIQIIF